MGTIYRTFGTEFDPIVASVCRSELINAAQIFSIEDFRTKRLEIKTHLKKRLAKRLSDDYSMILFEFFVDSLSFTKEINRLNLLRTLNDIYNEKAVYEKLTNMTTEETRVQVEKIRNKASVVLSGATLNAQHVVVGRSQTDLEYKLETTHLSGLNVSLSELEFTTSARGGDRSAQLQRMMSFCYVSSLIYNQNVTFFERDRKFDSYIYA